MRFIVIIVLFLFSCFKRVDVYSTKKINQFEKFYDEILKDDSEVRKSISSFVGLLGQDSDSRNRNLFMIATMACGRDQKECDDSFIDSVFNYIIEELDMDIWEASLEIDDAGNNLGAYLLSGGFTKTFFQLLEQMIKEKGTENAIKFLSNKSKSIPSLAKYNNVKPTLTGEWGVLEIAVKRNGLFLDIWPEFVERQGDIGPRLWKAILGDTGDHKKRTNFLHLMFEGDMEERSRAGFMKFVKSIAIIDEGKTLKNMLSQKSKITESRPLSLLAENDITNYEDFIGDFLNKVFVEVVGNRLLKEKREKISLVDRSIECGNEKFLEVVLSHLREQGITRADQLDHREGTPNFIHKICSRKDKDGNTDISMMRLPSIRELVFHNKGDDSQSKFAARKNSKDEGENTPLHLCTRVGPALIAADIDIVCFANVCLEENGKGLNPLQNAIVFGNIELVELMIDKLKEFGCLVRSLSKWAGQPIRIGEMPTMYRPTPLKLCALYGRVEIARLLIKEGVDIDEKSGCTTALLWAAKLAGEPIDNGPTTSKEEMVNLLLAADAKYRKPGEIKRRSLVGMLGKFALSALAGVGGSFSGVGKDRISVSTKGLIDDIDKIFIHKGEEESARELLREDKNELYVTIHKYVQKGGWKDCEILERAEVEEVEKEILKETTL